MAHSVGAISKAARSGLGNGKVGEKGAIRDTGRASAAVTAAVGRATCAAHFIRDAPRGEIGHECTVDRAAGGGVEAGPARRAAVPPFTVIAGTFATRGGVADESATSQSSRTDVAQAAARGVSSIFAVRGCGANPIASGDGIGSERGV